MAQKIYGRAPELAFFGMNSQAVLLESREQNLQVLDVLLKGLTGHEHVIQVHENKRQLADDHIHQTLERLSRIA